MDSFNMLSMAQIEELALNRRGTFNLCSSRKGHEGAGGG